MHPALTHFYEWGNKMDIRRATGERSFCELIQTQILAAQGKSINYGSPFGNIHICYGKSYRRRNNNNNNKKLGS